MEAILSSIQASSKELEHGRCVELFPTQLQSQIQEPGSQHGLRSLSLDFFGSLSLQKGFINGAGDESLDLRFAFECGVPCGVLHQPGAEERLSYLTGVFGEFIGQLEYQTHASIIYIYI